MMTVGANEFVLYLVGKKRDLYQYSSFNLYPSHKKYWDVYIGIILFVGFYTSCQNHNSNSLSDLVIFYTIIAHDSRMS